MMEKTIFKINGMHCASCAMSIDGDLEDTKGVKSAKTNYAKQECAVEFEEEVIKIKHIIKTIENTGYLAQVKMEGVIK